MPIIIPAILEKEFARVVEKIKRVEKESPETRLVQIDIADGVFVPNTTWANAKDLAKLQTSLEFEIHLMVEDPVESAKAWRAVPRARRVIAHMEVLEYNEFRKFSRLVQSRGREAGIAINPATSTAAIRDYLPFADMVLCMGVTPGFSGQSFKEDVLEKIRELHSLNPTMPISVDGGVNPETAPRITRAGATHLCAGSYLWKQENIGKAIKELLFLSYSLLNNKIKVVS